MAGVRTLLRRVLHNAIARLLAWVAALGCLGGAIIAGLKRIIFRKALDIGGDLC